MLEPRGHADMYGALLTAPEPPVGRRRAVHAQRGLQHDVRPRHHCRDHASRSSAACLSRGRRRELVLDSPAGPIHARARSMARDRGGRRHFRNVPSFVLHAGVPVRARNGRDMQSGRGVRRCVLRDRRQRIGRHSRQRPASRRSPAHGHGDQGGGRSRRSASSIHWTLASTVSTARSSPRRHREKMRDLRNVTIFADAEVDRSPCGTGTCAVMAVLAAMGLLGPDADLHPREHHRDHSSEDECGRNHGDRNFQLPNLRVPTCSPSFRRSKGRLTSPARTRFSSTIAIRCDTGSGSSWKLSASSCQLPAPNRR